MGTLFSRTDDFPRVPIDPIKLDCSIISRPINFEDPRYLTHDPLSRSLYISNSLSGKSVLLPNNVDSEYVINYPTRFLPRLPRDHRYPNIDRHTLHTECLSSYNIILVSLSSTLLLCSLDGQLISVIQYVHPRRFSEVSLLAVCADSLDVIYLLYTVNYQGNVRGEIIEISCTFTSQERFAFGIDHIKVARDICKRKNKLFVLHESDRCILVFSIKDGILLSALVSGLASDLPNAVHIPMNLTVTSNNNIILSNWGDNTISFIDSKGNVIANINLSSGKIPYFKPSGLIFDEITRVLYCVVRGMHPQLLSIKLPDYMKKL
ncbi:hypothetical protein LOD99_1922 [Oopsacas minuta]|uniref:Uncharacterized protein n=1 Tax=Oopsacas minuta TaxID=111878 RepID=A0AAV7K5A8_9METZ|nr:hypothetical protein LOD99_1922 [Oopsacas minuta]